MTFVMYERENYVRNACFQGARWIPCHISISQASWDMYRREMEKVVLRHPLIFPNYQPGQINFDQMEFTEGNRAGEWVDPWGCVRTGAIDGLSGVVTGHPLSDWDNLSSYRSPNPAAGPDRGGTWEEAAKRAAEARAAGLVVRQGPAHGFFLMRLEYLRGFENLMVDIATADERLPRLIELVAGYQREQVKQWLALGVDVLELPEDLGTQTSSFISPRAFEKWAAPTYRELIRMSHAAGALVGVHSDGYIMDLMEQFMACGVDVINPQDLCNGIDNLARAIKGRMCIRLDIDRQCIVPFGARQEIMELIEQEVRLLGSPRGGLELVAGIYPPTPPENVDALCAALEAYYTFWWDGRGKA